MARKAPKKIILTAALKSDHPSPFTSIQRGVAKWKNAAQIIRSIAHVQPIAKATLDFSVFFLAV